MAEFKVISTQEEFDAAVQARLDRERAKYSDYETLRQKAGELDKLKAKNYEGQLQDLRTRLDTANEKLEANAGSIADLTTRAKKAERDLLCRTVAEENGLPAAMASRLTGETKEELTADAKTLAQFIKPAQGAAPLASLEGSGRAAFFGSTQEAQRDAAFNNALSGVLQELKGD